MSLANGCNPMRWDCATQGCFNLKKRPKIERFADCLPGRIAFSDIDAIVEIGGNLLLLEWKDHPHISTGQRVLFERLTRLCPATVLVVEGDAERMEIVAVTTVWQGAFSAAENADLQGLRARITQWAGWALQHPAILKARIPSHEEHTNDGNNN
jgi:hypothetical protein